MDVFLDALARISTEAHAFRWAGHHEKTKELGACIALIKKLLPGLSAEEYEAILLQRSLAEPGLGEVVLTEEIIVTVWLCGKRWVFAREKSGRSRPA